MPKTVLRSTLALLVLLAATAAPAWASDGPPRFPGAPGNGRRHAPPPEAYSACEGKTAGDAVQVTGRRGEIIAATCRELDGRLVAIPDHRPGAGPPPEGRPAGQ